MIVPLAALAILLFLLSRSSATPALWPKMSAGAIGKVASVGAVAVAIAVLLRGNVWAALVLFGLALWLLGRASRGEKRTRSSTSRVRSAMVEMDFDQATGAMDGRIIAGPHEGFGLAQLDRQQCFVLYALCCRDDPDGVRLLEPYLDRRFAGWRAAGHGDTDPGERKARVASRMSEDEAYEILGLRRGASRADIVRSHRAVMKKWHPDQGGTADLAAWANEAKEVLMRRHV